MLNILNALICNLWFHSWATYLIFTDACNIAKSTDVLISCKLLIHFYLIFIVQCLSPYIVESFCATSFCTESFCIASFLLYWLKAPVLIWSLILYEVLLYRVFLLSHSLWIKNKHHHQNISKSKVLRLLSIIVGPVHEPPLPRGVVNQRQYYFQSLFEHTTGFLKIIHHEYE